MSFLSFASGVDKLPFRFTGKELDEETGLYYYGARYLDPKYSRWLSGDPAITDYMSGSSVGDGGIYNTVNLSVYHYAGNNPVKYTDPDGRLLINNVSENSASAREYERNHNLRYIAFADSSELGVFGPNSSINQKLVNQKENEVINTVLHISNANLVEDK